MRRRHPAARSVAADPAAASAPHGESDDSPRWDLTPVYPGVDSSAFEKDLKLLRETVVLARAAVGNETLREQDPAGWLTSTLDLLNQADDLFETLESFCYATFSVKTDDETAAAALNRVTAEGVPLASLEVEFRNALASLSSDPRALVDQGAVAEGYRFVLEEELAFQKRQMSAAEENLAADLNRSGADAWTRLHETITSSLEVVWDETTGETRTVVNLRSCASDPDRSVRRRAWEKELAAWKQAETPLAFALNGIKGATHTLNTRRGWESTLEKSAAQNRLSLKALDALITTMRDALPMFRRYLTIKARALGLPALSFYDILAPVGHSTATWTFDRAIAFIAEQVGAFDPEQGAFVRAAQHRRWIDAEPRPGKVGGAYCIDYPRAKQSRILANFDGTYDGMSTLAHELGHAWHSEQMRELPAKQRHYPMTLAETASIFSETLVFFSAVEQADDREELYIVEQFLQGTTQVIVDILSRFIFESELMKRRADGEVPARELCEMMLHAQRETYGDGLNQEELHPYMWAVKGHYYHADLAFYNFPYAFGQLFGLGLYGKYQEEPEGFSHRYRRILASTGRADAVTVTASAGFDIESTTFWRSGIERIGALVDRFESLVRRNAPRDT